MGRGQEATCDVGLQLEASVCTWDFKDADQRLDADVEEGEVGACTPPAGRACGGDRAPSVSLAPGLAA